MAPLNFNTENSNTCEDTFDDVLTHFMKIICKVFLALLYAYKYTNKWPVYTSFRETLFQQENNSNYDEGLIIIMLMLKMMMIIIIII